MDVNIPLISNVPSISVFDHHKNSQSVKYMKPFSEAIHIMGLTYIWYSNNKIGLQWNIIQSKIFHPIAELTECIIQDEYEQEPMQHYHHTLNNISCKRVTTETKEQHPIYGAFIKMKRMGVPDQVIRNQLLAKKLSYPDFLQFETTGIMNSQCDVLGANSSGFLKEISGIHKLKKTKQLSRTNRKFQNNSNFAPTSIQLKQVLLNLKKVVK